jgi:hypothetical protein
VEAIDVYVWRFKLLRLLTESVEAQFQALRSGLARVVEPSLLQVKNFPIFVNLLNLHGGDFEIMRLWPEEIFAVS